MKIYAAFIIKDDSELDSFSKALESVQPYVDGWYIVANGKKTAQIEAYTASHGGHYYHKQWNDDFSEQRNFIFSKVPADADYIYWMDADDILIGGELLREVAETTISTGKDVVFLDYWYGCSFSGKPSKETFIKVDVTHARERLIKPGTHVWKGRLHETPIPNSGRKDSYVKVGYKDVPIAIMHTKTMDDALETMKRNQRILEIQLADEKKKGEADPRTLLYLMKIYAELDENYWKQCIAMGEEYLKKSGWDEERATCCDLMAICYNKLGDTNKSIKLLHDAIREYPHYPLLYVRLAKAYLLVNKPKQAKHWLEVGVSLPIEKTSSGITHVQELKIVSAQVLLQLRLQEKDYKGALAAMEVLIKEQPNDANQKQYYDLQDVVDLQEACKKTDELFSYLESIGDKQAIAKSLDVLPQGITRQPFAIGWRQKVTHPRVWKPNEICYFANFGGGHFEKWDGRSLETGLGGSETAVIELSKELTNLGYKVTVYGDPEEPCVVDGVTYLPWYYANTHDYFNIFIAWRSSQYTRSIKARRIICDMHDLFDDNQLEKNAVDTFMFKSEYHKSLSKDTRSAVVSNGIRP